MIQVYSYRAASLLKLNALVACRAHVICLDVTKSRRRYLFDHGYTLLGFLPVGTAELKVEDRNLVVDDSDSLYGLTSPDMGPLERFVPQTF